MGLEISFFLQPVDQRKAEICWEDCSFKDYSGDKYVSYMYGTQVEQNLTTPDGIQMTKIHVRLHQKVIDELEEC